MNAISVRDQENLTHTHQQAAAAKPLNQGARGLAPKTPGNNGNRNGLNGRTGRANRGQDDENMFLGGGKTGKAGKPTFITPLARRERAPLGAKTTNVKANAFKTPMPKTGGYEMQKTQIRSTSARKHKLKVHQPEVIAAEPMIQSEDEEEPEIEYCPPKITPMLDLPEIGFSPNHRFPEIDTFDYLRDAYETSRDRRDPIGPDGLRKSEREAQKERKEWDEHTDRLLEEAARQTCTLTDADYEFWGMKPVQKQPLDNQTQKTGLLKSSTRTPSTSTSRTPALTSSTRAQPSFAAPTAAAKARKAAVLSSNTVAPASRTLTPGEAASRTTVGYSAGRKVSSEMRQQRNKSPEPTRKPSQPVITLDDIVKEFQLQQDQDDDDDDEGMPFKRIDPNDIVLSDEITNFRLEL